MDNSWVDVEKVIEEMARTPPAYVDEEMEAVTLNDLSC